MLLKKNENGQRTNSSASVWALVTPRPGHNQEEVLQQLNRLGVKHQEVLAPGFISVEASRNCLQFLEPIAEVEIKPVNRLHLQ